jgi:hypothetical protein
MSALLLVAPNGCSGEAPRGPVTTAGDSGTVGNPAATAIEIAEQRYVNFETLAKRVDTPVAVRVLGSTSLDARAGADFAARVHAEYVAQTRVVPYIRAQSITAPYEWLDVQLVDKQQLAGNLVGDQVNAKLVEMMNAGLFPEAWELEMELELGAEKVQYKAFLLKDPAPGSSIWLMDPVLRAADYMADAPLMQMLAGPTPVNAETLPTFKGCEEDKKLTMPQGKFGLDGKYRCFYYAPAAPLLFNYFDSTCRVEADMAKDSVATLVCDTKDPACKRQAGSAVQSTSPTVQTVYTAGVYEKCAWAPPCGSPGIAYTESNKHADSQSSTVLGQGVGSNGIDESCQLHTNIETLVLGTPVAWEIGYTTPKNPLGTAYVKFTGAIPELAVYQVVQQIACCQAPTGDLPKDAGTGGTGGTGGGSANPDAGDDYGCGGKIGLDCFACCEISSDPVACFSANQCS